MEALVVGATSSSSAVPREVTPGGLSGASVVFSQPPEHAREDIEITQASSRHELGASPENIGDF
jgi:hypothetical protein